MIRLVLLRLIRYIVYNIPGGFFMLATVVLVMWRPYDASVLMWLLCLSPTIFYASVVTGGIALLERYDSE